MEDNSVKTIPPQANSVGAVIIFFILLFLFAKWGPAIPFSTTTQSRGEPLVVSGEGKVSVTPDIAKVSAGIEESGTSLKTIQNSVNTKSKNLVDALKRSGIDEKDIKTTSYNVFPQYDYSVSSTRITGYRVSTNYEVTVRDFDKVNDILVVITQNGANIVGGISFEVNDDTKQKKLQEAREEAVAEAKKKAQGLARASGITLGKIINVSENQGVDFPRPLALDKSLPVSGGGESIPAPEITPGETEITVSVSLSYEIR